MTRGFDDPVRRGFVLLCLAVGCVGYALGVMETVTANFFVEVLHLDGPQFGYITAIREVPGFLLIFIVAALYRLTLPHLTALALVVLCLGFAGYGTATSFGTVVPWVIASSLGYHVMLQTYHALAMNLTTVNRSGTVIGQVGSAMPIGMIAAKLAMWSGFGLGILGFIPAFLTASAAALIGAAAVFFFPNMRDGRVEAVVQQRQPLVLRRRYSLYYALKFLDGARMQIFFSFGAWVLVQHFGLDVAGVALVQIAAAGLTAVFTPWIGRLMDQLGERTGLGVANVGYVLILGAFGLVDNVYVASVAYVIYQLMAAPAEIGASVYLRKIATPEDLAPSLAMGLSISHAAAIIVPVAAGFILNWVGYQVPFLLACGVASITFLVTRRLSSSQQRITPRLAGSAGD